MVDNEKDLDQAEITVSMSDVFQRLNEREYIASVRALGQFVLPVVLIFSLFICFTVGVRIFSSLVMVPLVILYAAGLFSIYEFFDKRNLDVSSIPTKNLLRRLIVAAAIRGICCGFIIVLCLPLVNSDKQAGLLMLVILLMILSLTSISMPLLLSFGLPPAIIVALGTFFYSTIDGFLIIVILAFSSLMLILGAVRARKTRIESMQHILESELIEKEHLESERKMRAYEAEVAKKELSQQEATRKMQDDLIAGLAFPVVISSGDDVLLATPECRRQFKFGETDITKLPLSDFFCIKSEQKQMIEVLGQDGKIDNYEILMKDLEGVKFWVAVSMRPIKYDNQHCWIISIFNLDDRKRMEQELSSAKESAETALEQLKTTQQSLIHAEKMASLGQLTAGIAHEIKNPLNFVNNFAKLSAEMMSELAEILEAPINSLDEEEREDATELLDLVRDNLLKIDEHGQRADSIVKNMLEHSREGGQDKQDVDINSLVEEALNLAYHGARANDKSFNIDLVKEFDPKIGSIMGLAQELQRVILNLCSNGMYEAVKSAKSKKQNEQNPKLIVRTRTDNNNVYIEIIDNGGGVPDEIKGKIFHPFFTTKPTGEGTGLGLSMSYDIVKEHDGDLTVHDNKDAGANFQIRIPRLI